MNPEILSFLGDTGRWLILNALFPFAMWSAVLMILHVAVSKLDALSPKAAIRFRYVGLLSLPAVFAIFWFVLPDPVTHAILNNSLQDLTGLIPDRSQTGLRMWREATPISPANGLFFAWDSVLAGAITVLLGLGMLVGLGWFAFQFANVYNLIRSFRNVEDEAVMNRLEKLKSDLGIQQNVRLHHSNTSLPPFTMGTRNPAIYIPTELLTNQRLTDAVLAHELTHIKNGDYGLHLFDQAIRRMFWFNPPILRWMDRITYHRELRCDKNVLSHNLLDTKEYAQLILDHIPTQTTDTVLSTSMAQSHTRERIHALPGLLSEKPSPGNRFLSGLAAVLLLIVLPASSYFVGSRTSVPLEFRIKDERILVDNQQVFPSPDMGYDQVPGEFREYPFRFLHARLADHTLFSISAYPFEGATIESEFADSILSFQWNGKDIRIVSSVPFFKYARVKAYIRATPNYTFIDSTGLYQVNGKMEMLKKEQLKGAPFIQTDYFDEPHHNDWFNYLVMHETTDLDDPFHKSKHVERGRPSPGYQTLYQVIEKNLTEEFTTGDFDFILTINLDQTGQVNSINAEPHNLLSEIAIESAQSIPWIPSTSNAEPFHDTNINHSISVRDGRVFFAMDTPDFKAKMEQRAGLVPKNQKTFRVTVPHRLPEFETVYWVGSLNNWQPGHRDYAMKPIGESQYEITIPNTWSSPVEYKYTLGGWGFEEKNTDQENTPNRVLPIEGDTIVYDTVIAWPSITQPLKVRSE